MANEYFRPNLIRFPQENVVMADIHGNWSALSAVLDDIEQKHKLRVAESLIDTIDANFDGGKMRKMVRNVFRNTIPDKDQKRESIKQRIRDKIRKEVDFVLPNLPKPKKFCLGDLLGYYGQSREILNAMKDFDGVCQGNHERIIKDIPFSADFKIIMRSTGMGSYSSKSSVAIRNRLNQGDIDFIKSLPEHIRVRDDVIGRHCHYKGETPMYPISRKVATSERYFSNEGQLATLAQEPEDIYDMSGTFQDEDVFELVAHSHVPTYTQFDEKGNSVLDISPKNVELGTQNKSRSYFLSRFTLPLGHKALVGVGSVGISRRMDKEIIQKLKDRGIDSKQLYYLSLIGKTCEYREVYYDINYKGTLKATIDAGIELRGEDVQDEQ